MTTAASLGKYEICEVLCHYSLRLPVRNLVLLLRVKISVNTSFEVTSFLQHCSAVAKYIKEDMRKSHVDPTRFFFRN